MTFDYLSFFNFGLLILIWLVQLVIYPSFKHWDRRSFARNHAWYTGAITWVVLPLMFGQVGMLVVHWSPDAGGIIISQCLLVAIAWLATFSMSVPLHRRLQQGWDMQTIDRLVISNVLRTIAWTIVFLLDFWR